MQVLSRSVRGVLLAGATASLLSACIMEPGKYTGGGTLNSLGGAGPAQVAFTADSCDPDNVKGQVVYNDKTAIEYQAIGGVSFRGNVVRAGVCTSEYDETQAPEEGAEYDNSRDICSQNGGPRHCKVGQYAIELDYISTSPGAPGTGRALVCSEWAGSGAGGGNHATILPITVLSGPLEGYINDGTLIGNASFQACKDGGA